MNDPEGRADRLSGPCSLALLERAEGPLETLAEGAAGVRRHPAVGVVADGVAPNTVSAELRRRVTGAAA